MNQNANTLFQNAEVIYAYTRKQAIDDGVLVDLTALFPDDTRMYKHPVACTSRVWEKIKSVSRTLEHAGAYVWDICYMSQKFQVKKIDELTVLFDVGLPLGARKATRLKLQVHPGDEGEPVITIMYPDED